jgi:pimeloyl-ACP methyl ester carboxylesterase
MSAALVALLVYLLVEACRLWLLYRYRRHLHRNRTPLSVGFDRRAWGEFMVAGLRREAELGRECMEQWIVSVFQSTPIHKLSRGDVDKWLRMYISVRELVDGPIEPWAEALADQARRIIEGSLDFRFPPGVAQHNFARINHPLLNDHPPGVALRPLPLLLGFKLLRVGGDFWLRLCGYKRWVDVPTGFVFWHYRRTAPAAAEEAIRPRRGLLFISGLGNGLSFYPHHALAFLRDPAFTRQYSDVCLCEIPGVSGTPLRAGHTYPTASETVAAMERFARRLALPTLDGIGHSGGAFVLSFASRYAPNLFAKSVYAEAPATFFAHASKAYPLLFAPFTLRRLARSVLSLDLVALSNHIVMSEIHHQHFIVNAIWFMEVCHREEAATLNGERAMLVLGTHDEYVDGPTTARYFAKYHPRVTVHLMRGWTHGSFWDPTKLQTNLTMLRAFLCVAADRGAEPDVGELRLQPSNKAPVVAQTSPSSVRHVFL